MTATGIDTINPLVQVLVLAAMAVKNRIKEK
jgi:hypothetical protein